MRIRLASFGLLLALCSFCAAQPSSNAPVVVPRLVRFSGQVVKATGSVGITFTLHKTQHDNSPLWIETQNVELDVKGNYSVLLGATKPQGIPMELFTSGEAQWLAVRVDGHPEQPRVLLVSVPYALKAAEAETLAGHAAADFVTAEKLTSAVHDQLQQEAAPSSGTAPKLIANNAATNFSASNASQVVLVTQTGTGAGLAATAAGTAIRGTSSAPGGFGVQGVSNATTGTGAGVRGSVSSPAANAVYGANNATTGPAIGVLGTSASTSGIAVRASANATTGATQGLQATVASPGGTAGVFQNISSGGQLLSGRAGSAHTEVFSVNAAGGVSGTSYSIGPQLFAWGKLSAFNVGLGFAGGVSATTGEGNTAVGYSSLNGDTTGSSNAAVGYLAMQANSTGNFNTAIGATALKTNTTGIGSVAVGAEALQTNDVGYWNNAVGFDALYANTSGLGNNAIGYDALLANTTGNANIAIGTYALESNTTGGNNIAIGYAAGHSVSPGNGDNIHIGNPGLSGDSGTIRIGSGGTHNSIYLAGVLNSAVSGAQVLISNTGQLGIATSSARYKDDIADMGDSSRAIFQLRPVTFHYKKPDTDGSKPLQFGLIAEEVAKVMPEAVFYNEAGQPESVLYNKINAMLLNEVQRQQKEIDDLKATVEQMKALVHSKKKK